MRHPHSQTLVALAAMGVACLAWLTTGSHVAAACVQAPRPIVAIETAPIAFVGTVTAIDSRGAATYQVGEIWKGTNLPNPVVVYPILNPADAGAAGPARAIGTRYLVFPSVDADGNVRDEECSSTSVYQDSFAAFRPAGAHAPQGPPTSGLPGDTPIAAVFLAILVMGSAGAFFLYRSGSAVAQGGG